MSSDVENNRQIKLETELNLSKDFLPPGFDQWKTLVEKSLKGAPFEEKLVTQTYEGINLQPIYTKKDIQNLPHLEQKPGFKDFVRGTKINGYIKEPWEICQEINTPFANQFNEALTFDLLRGQTGINLVLDLAGQKGLDSDAALTGETGKGGLAVSTLEDFSTALAGIDMEKYPLHIIPGYSNLEMLMMLTAFLKQAGKDIDELKGSIDADPLGFMAVHGGLPVPMEKVFAGMAQAVKWTVQYAPHLKTIGVCGLPYHNAGADAVQELAYMLAAAVQYIEGLTGSDQTLTVDDIAGSMRFTFGIGPFYFMEIAKIRAARMLWAKIIQAWGGSNDSQKMTIHARTSTYNQTLYDPYVNMLRTTTEAFSAVAAGVDSLHTNAFNEVFSGGSDEFSRRVARNTQIILREECGLNRSIDPAGSYYLEKLTAEVAQKAWEKFQEIEAKGGMFKTLQEGFPQKEIETVAEKRREDIKQGKSLMVGTNFSVNEKEEKPSVSSPDYEEILKVRDHYLKEYRNSRSTEQKKKIEKKQSQLKNLSASGTGDIIGAGAEAFLSGATLGEITAAMGPPDEEGKLKPPIKIKPLKLHRAAEMVETSRDEGVLS